MLLVAFLVTPVQNSSAFSGGGTWISPQGGYDYLYYADYDSSYYVGIVEYGSILVGFDNPDGYAAEMSMEYSYDSVFLGDGGDGDFYSGTSGHYWEPEFNAAIIDSVFLVMSNWGSFPEGEVYGWLYAD